MQRMVSATITFEGTGLVEEEEKENMIDTTDYFKDEAPLLTS